MGKRVMSILPQPPESTPAGRRRGKSQYIDTLVEVTYCIPTVLQEQLQAIAHTENQSVDDVMCLALERFVTDHEADCVEFAKQATRLRFTLYPKSGAGAS